MNRGLRYAIVTLLAGLLLAACGDAPAPGGLQDLPAGQALPAATLTVLGDDTAVDLGAIDGPTVINFWATWCAFCVDEMPDLEAVHRELGDAVRFIGVDREDSVRKALELVAETGVTYEMVEDPDGSYFQAVQGRGMPTTVFVDGSGTIRYRHAGPLDAVSLRALIAEHLGV